MPASNVRRIGTIWRNLQEFLDSNNPNTVKLIDPLAIYQNGPGFSQQDLVLAMNGHPPFDRDGVTVIPHNVVNPGRVSHLLLALLDAYEAAGWEVKQ